MNKERIKERTKERKRKNEEQKARKTKKKQRQTNPHKIVQNFLVTEFGSKLCGDHVPISLECYSSISVFLNQRASRDKDTRVTKTANFMKPCFYPLQSVVRLDPKVMELSYVDDALNSNTHSR